MDRDDVQSDAVMSHGSLVPPLPDGYLEAGRLYVKALTKFGLTPELAIWARDSTIDDWVLLLGTSLLDAVGPLHLMETLFSAYDHKGTPSEISPFVIRLQSPNDGQMLQLIGMLDGKFRPQVMLAATSASGETIPIRQSNEGSDLDQTRVGDLAVQAGWRYVVGREKAAPANPFKTFKIFKRQVQQLAA